MCDFRTVVMFKINFFWHLGRSVQPCMLFSVLSGSQTCAAGTLLLITLCNMLTQWGRVTHKCVNNLIIIGSENGLSPGRRLAIIWTDTRLLLIGHLILIEIYTFSFKKMHLKMSSEKWRPSFLGLNMLNNKWEALYVYTSIRLTVAMYARFCSTLIVEENIHKWNASNDSLTMSWYYFRDSVLLSFD